MHSQNEKSSFTNAKIAQLVEHDLAKVGVAGSSPVFRSLERGCSSGGTGRHAGLKILWPLRLCGFKSRLEYSLKIKELDNLTPFLLFTYT